MPPPLLDAQGHPFDCNAIVPTPGSDAVPDALSSVLKTVRIEGASFRQSDLAPGARIEGWEQGQHDLRARHPAMDHAVSIHYIVDGRCGIAHPRRAEPARAKAGELVLCAAGDETLSAAVCEGTRARVVSGVLACRQALWRRIADTLPPVLVVPDLQARASALVNVVLQAGLHESRDARPGGGSSLVKMAELLVVETVRLHAERMPSHRCRWLAAARDTHIGRALALIHAHPDYRWSLQDLAVRVALSRSALAERFRRMLGQSPIQYLTGLRMRLAAESLAQGSLSIAQVAERAGYDSEAAFNRAFKRAFGTPPGVWRMRGEGVEAMPA